MRTRTISILYGLILFSGLSIHAQEFKFGLIGGLDVSNAHRIRPEFYDRYFYPMITYNVNGYIGFKSTGFWGLSVEPGFIQKGGNRDPSLKSAEDNYVRYLFNYFQVPFLSDFYISDKLFLSIGPEIAWLIKAKIRYPYGTFDLMKGYIKEIEVSGLVGINYKIMENIDIGLRYNHGLTFTYVDGDIKDYNQYVQLIIRFKINTGSKY